MRHSRREVDKVAGADFRRVLQTLSPPDLAAALADIDRDLVRAVVMRTGSPVRLQCDCSHPDIWPAAARKLECGGPALARDGGRSHHPHSVISPIPGTHGQLH